MSDLETYARTRDPELRDRLIRNHLPLARFVARRICAKLPEHMDLDDVVSLGAIGLMDAIEKFEPERGLKFSTYAVTRIRGEILDGLQRMEWASKQTVSGVRKIRKAQNQLANELGREPTTHELAEALQLDEGRVRELLAAEDVLYVHSLDTRVTADVEERIQDALADGLAEEQQVAGEVAELRTRMSRALAPLSAHEARVLLMYYRDSLTLKEVAAELGVSVSSATQEHTRLVDGIRERLALQG